MQRRCDVMEKEFMSYIRDIVSSKEFLATKNHRHHINGTVYSHSVKVAYLCYKYHKKHKLNMDIKDLVRGALLHDFYLYNLHGDGKKHRFHWFKHPSKALNNAIKKYPDLTEMQRDMIKHHMFPLTPIPPKTKAGWIICFYDKVAAVSDRFERKNRSQKH